MSTAEGRLAWRSTGTEPREGCWRSCAWTAWGSPGRAPCGTRGSTRSKNWKRRSPGARSRGWTASGPRSWAGCSGGSPPGRNWWGSHCFPKPTGWRNARRRLLRGRESRASSRERCGGGWRSWPPSISCAWRRLAPSGRKPGVSRSSAYRRAGVTTRFKRPWKASGSGCGRCRSGWRVLRSITLPGLPTIWKHWRRGPGGWVSN